MLGYKNMMNYKSLIYLIIILAVIGGLFGWYVYRDLPKEPVDNNAVAQELLNRDVVINIEMTDERKEKWTGDLTQVKKDLEANLDSLQNWLQLGLLFKSAGDYEGARDIWEYASVIRPSNSISFHNIGDVNHYYLKNFEEAEKNYLKAIENAPAQFFTYNNLYELYRYSVEDMDKAEKILLRGIDDNPMDPYLMILLGIFYEETGKTSDALFYYEKALGFDSGNEALKKDIDRLK